MNIISFVLFSMPMIFIIIGVILLSIYLYYKVIKKRTEKKYLIGFIICVVLLILSSIYLTTLMK